MVICLVYILYTHNYIDHYLCAKPHACTCRIRQAEKKKKKLHIKRPGAKKDEKKRVLLALKEHMQLESTDGADSSDSDSELGGGGGGIRESPSPRIRTPTMS